jgi:hypothetical protein
MVKIILGVIVGFVATAVLSTGTDFVFISAGLFPHYGEPFLDDKILILPSVYRAAFQVLGAYLACTVAKDKAKTTVWIIGILGSFFWLLGSFLNAEMAPMWYGILGAVLSIPTVLAGLKIYESRNKFTAQ